MAEREQFTQMIDQLLELVEYYSNEHTDELRSQIDETLYELQRFCSGTTLDSTILL